MGSGGRRKPYSTDVAIPRTVSGYHNFYWIIINYWSSSSTNRARNSESWDKKHNKITTGKQIKEKISKCKINK